MNGVISMVGYFVIFIRGNLDFMRKIDIFSLS